jgi:hypothetical protein
MSSSKPQAAGSGIFGCLGLAFAAVLIHGYHLGTDDAAIWVPTIKKAADPSLFPFGGEFFLHHANLSCFPRLLGWFIRLTHVPADTVIFLCHVVGVFLLLLAGRQLLSACFENHRARWAGVALLAAVLSVPVAGTALVIMDPYVTSRTLSTPFALFAIAAYLSGWRGLSWLWLAGCFVIHFQMSLYAAVLLGLMHLYRRRVIVSEPAHAFGLLLLFWLPLPWNFEPARDAAREALLSRSYFFVTNWTWYEWFGAIAPLVLLWCCARLPLRGTRQGLAILAMNVTNLGILFTIAALALVSTPRLENYTRLQPMRAFHLVYIVLFLLLGAVAGEYVLKDRAWRWLALFTPLAAGMWLLAYETFPGSDHVEWPGATPHGAWYTAFLWTRDHTPKDAVFAINPDYLLQPGEDMHGFRAVAERSVLADRVKDSGAVSLFPDLGTDWKNQLTAQSGWSHFSRLDFQRLARRYPVTWIVTRRAAAGLDCPYQNAGLAVCRIGAVVTQ